MLYRVWVKVMARSRVSVKVRVRVKPDDLDDHPRRLQPIDLNLDLLGITHLVHESRLMTYAFFNFLHFWHSRV